MVPMLRLAVVVHALGLGALALVPEHWPLAVGALVATHLAITWGTVTARSALLGPNMSRLPDSVEGRVALTFDDGPDPEVTPAVLDILDHYGARATFFCVGRKVAAYPEVAALIVARGHFVENHTDTHPLAFAFRSPAALTREIEGAQDRIHAATGRRPVYFRAPAGIRNVWVAPCLDRAGLALVSWSRRGWDTVTRDPEAVVRRLEKARAGDVLLLHDGNSALSRSGCPVVLEVLPRLLATLKSRSLSAVALPPRG